MSIDFETLARFGITPSQDHTPPVAYKEPTCPECGSLRLTLVVTGYVARLECDDCRSSFVASQTRLVEACLLSHLDASRLDFVATA